MTVVDGFTEHCLRLAARRWPADVRNERYREWTAEMHMIKNDSATPAPRRTWEQLRFAFSLAASPPAPDENRVPRGWREVVPRLGLWLRPWLVLLGMGAVCVVLDQPVRDAVTWVVSWASRTDPPNWSMSGAVAYPASLAAVTAVAAWLGVVTGRRFPLLRAPRGRAARVVSVAGAPVMVAVGVMAMHAGRHLPYFEGISTYELYWLYSPLLWLVPFAAVTVVAVWLVRRGRTGLGRTVGVVAGVVALDVIAMPITYLGASSMGGGIRVGEAALWFPMSLAPPFFRGGSSLSMTGVTQIMPTLVIASGFVLCYAITSCRVRAPQPRSAARPVATATVAVSRPRAGFALVTAAVGLAAWAVGLAYATPRGSGLARLGDSQFVMWASELRFGSIMVVALALGLAMVGRGRPVVTASVAALGLLSADTVLDQFDRTGTPGLSGALGFGAIILAAAWWLGRTLLLAPPSPTGVRRGHIGIAVTAALSAPTILLQASWPETASDAGPLVPTPAVFPVLTTVVAISLSALAGVAAVAARRRTGSVPVSVALVAVPVLAFGGCAVLSGQNLDLAGIAPVATSGLLLGLPYTVWLLAVMWWDRVRRPARAATVWTVAAVIGVPVTVPAAIAASLLSFMVAIPLMALQGTGYPADGATLLPGAVVAAVALGAAAAVLLARHPRPAADAPSHPAPTPHGIPHGRDPYPATS